MNSIQAPNLECSVVDGLRGMKNNILLTSYN